MDGTILVTGGTGRIGRAVVPLLRAAGREVRVLSRHAAPDEPGLRHAVGDTVKGEGLAEAFAGASTVLHLAGGATGDEQSAHHVAEAARAAGAGHLILISVVGAGRMPIGYFRAKAEAERIVAASGVPWSILAVSQVHEFLVPLVRGLSRMPVTPRPGGLRFEPVHRDEVAAALAELALGEPVGRAPDLAGPEVLDVAQLVRTYSGRTRPTLPIRLPGAIGRAYRAGENLADGTARRGRRTWADFVASDAGAAAAGRAASALR